MEAQEIAAQLIGTCYSLDHILGNNKLKFENLDKEFLAELDGETRKCECCDWWVEADVVNDEGICDDCIGEK